MAAITTTEAATQADVTVATIRTWCRQGVIAAAKTAGRWVIDTASLSHRISIGARRTHQEATPMIDLAATYTFTHAGDAAPSTVTPVVKRRSTPHAGNTISISGLIPLFADTFNSIANEGDRRHALTLFTSARIVISDQHDAEWDDDPQTREGGQLRTTYTGTVPGISIDNVLDLAAALRTQLA
ncbi:helix-turn-helix domain-containing protein [Streptomyces niveus]|uniref:helix-turn-helix domain-containing protein n=1 Tax=Streptomyces niveus TaxID=193462 RepID=UPI0035DC75CB